ncbi:hypothetical protein OOZ19_06700 [Saccharopolyspora sp. NFXS83]|uniref:hypothetical protein n=1 Tax=Saccharopolyspora sp. NFXS83 TaxID=2993560 RepID=UPI00224AAAB3|nr:hypothetical protein [Saccharopolyspora sp. NFXS83]MCX2729922.1 hypothetical protein [Saccharopolyspora sp. NFXS83]
MPGRTRHDANGTIAFADLLAAADISDGVRSVEFDADLLAAADISDGVRSVEFDADPHFPGLVPDREGMSGAPLAAHFEGDRGALCQEVAPPALLIRRHHVDGGAGFGAPDGDDQ